MFDRLVSIDVPAIVVSFTISPVRINEKIDGMKRNDEHFSTISGFCSTNQISLLIVLKVKGRTPDSLYKSLRDKYLPILSMIGLVLSHCQEITGYSILPDLSNSVPSTPKVVMVTPAILSDINLTDHFL